ncbi:MAG: cytochrome b N-terminal domain-containing protein [Planctomycetia bacterium]|nr:cytochrome b N-terminal domain-containing protein [Planctomycetia bacterium]
MGPFKWLDERTGLWTGFRNVTHWTVPASLCLCRFLPVAIVFAFILQGITGLFLWAFYSASAQTAWESVFYIQYVVPYGWLVRGIHHYSAQLLVASLFMYVLMMILHGSYRRPREFVYWSAVVLFLFSLASCLTGDLLMWSLSGYFATMARVAFLQILPEIGVPLYKLVVGSPDPQFGTLTLTRFLVLHIAVFGGGFLGVMIFWKWADFRSRKLIQEPRFCKKHSCALACAVAKRRTFWGCEAVMCALTCVVFLAAVLALVMQHSYNEKQISERAATLPAEAYLGAELTSPADPGGSYDAARPEWSFRALYYMSKLPIFSEIGMIYAIFVIPTLLGLYFFAIPILGRFSLFHYCIVLITFGLFVVFCWFTYASYWDDYKNPEHAPTFLAGQAQANVLKKRAVELCFAPAGIPKSGALGLLQKDPFIQGPKIFEQQCSSCHNFQQFGDIPENSDYQPIISAEPTAPNLYNCLSEEWMHGYQNLEKIVSDDYFGKTTNFAEKGSMVVFLKGRIYGGLDTDDGSFVLNNSGLIYSVIGYDASPAFDILQASFEELVEVEENAEIIQNGEYIEKLKEIVAAKFDDAAFLADLQPKLPAPVLAALKSVLLDMFADKTYIELLKDEDNIAMILDDDIDSFLEDSYLLTLCGNDEPIAPEDQKYIKQIRQGLFESCHEMGEILYEESKLDEIRPFVEGKYLGLRDNAISDFEFLTCTECHAFYGKENDHACDLRGYMSRDWLIGIISDPTSLKYYGANNDRMPAYHPATGDKLMSQEDIELLADWLHGNWYRAPEVNNKKLLGEPNAAVNASKAAAELKATEEAQKAIEKAALNEKIQQEAKERAEKEAADLAAKEKAAQEKIAKDAQAAADKLAAEKTAKEEIQAALDESQAALKEALTTIEKLTQENKDSVEKLMNENQKKVDQINNEKIQTIDQLTKENAEAIAAEKAAKEAAEQLAAETKSQAEKTIADLKAETDKRIADLTAELEKAVQEKEMSQTVENNTDSNAENLPQNEQMAEL